MIKKILAVICTIYIVSTSVFALPSHTGEFYVNDFADVLDAATEKHVVNMSALIEKETGAQLVVVTVESLDGKTDAQYALELGREWGIGDKEKDNGFLMLIYPGTGKGDGALRFEVGYGLEGALPDGKCGRIQDEYMMPFLTNGKRDFSGAVLKGYDQVVAEVCKEYGIDIPKEVDATPLKEDNTGLIVMIILVIIIIIISIKTPPSSRGPRFIFFGGPGSFGGHGGGGGFTGGGFSGGGGSFGGGGSSRRF